MDGWIRDEMGGYHEGRWKFLFCFHRFKDIRGRGGFCEGVEEWIAIMVCFLMVCCVLLGGEMMSGGDHGDGDEDGICIYSHRALLLAETHFFHF